MLIRIAILGLVASAVAGCANEGMPGLGAGFATSALSAQTATVYAAGADHDGSDAVPRKTLASKVLAAIALERVTGWKPDPSRFID